MFIKQEKYIVGNEGKSNIFNDLKLGHTNKLYNSKET